MRNVLQRYTSCGLHAFLLKVVAQVLVRVLVFLYAISIRSHVFFLDGITLGINLLIYYKNLSIFAYWLWNIILSKILYFSHLLS